MRNILGRYGKFIRLYLSLAASLALFLANINAFASEPTVLYQSDFNEYVTADIAEDGKNQRIRFTDSGGTADEAWLTASSVAFSLEEEGDNKFLRLTGTSGRLDPYIWQTISYDENSMAIEASIRLNAGAGSGGYVNIGLRDASGSTKIMLTRLECKSDDKAKLGILYTSNSMVNTSPYGYTCDYDYDSWAKIKIVLKNIDGADGQYVKADAYLNGEKVLSGASFPNDNFKSEKVQNWTRIYLAGRDGSAGNGKLDFDDITISVSDETPGKEHFINYEDDFSGDAVGERPQNKTGFSYMSKPYIEVTEENGEKYLSAKALGTDHQFGVNLGSANTFKSYQSKLLFTSRVKFETGKTGHTRIRMGEASQNYVQLLLFQNHTIGVLDYDGNAKNAVSGWTYADDVWYEISMLLDFTEDTPLFSAYIYGENGDRYAAEKLELLPENLTTYVGTVTQSWIDKAYCMFFYSNSVEDGMKLLVDRIGVCDVFSENDVVDTQPEQDGEGVDCGTEISVTFSNPINISSGECKLTADGGYDEELSSVSLRDNAHTLVLKPAEALVNGAKYHVRLSGLGDYFTDGSLDAELDFTAANSEVFVKYKSFSEDSAENPNITFRFAANNEDDSAKRVKLILAQCEGSAESYSISRLAQEEYEIAAGAADEVISVSITAENAGKDTFIQAFAVDADTLKPLMHTSIILNI